MMHFFQFKNYYVDLLKLLQSCFSCPKKETIFYIDLLLLIF